MPIRTIAGSALQYHLIAYDQDGNERREPDGSLLSEAVRARAADAAQPVTDVFLASHGWKGDMPAAIEQYDAWMGAVAALESDLARARQRRANFTPLVVGLHWPSLPWGDESLASGGPGFLAGDATAAADPATRVDAFAARIADTPAARAALDTLFAAADRGVEPSADGTLPPDVQAAYAALFAESRLAAAEVAAPPGADQDGFDPAAIVRDTQASEGGPGGDAGAPGLLGPGIASVAKDLLLSPLRQLSFWKMKDRARRFGETGAHALLATLQSAAPAGTRFHLMGHSFGCIVVSAAVVGGANAAPLPRPVSSLFLVQGALSVWAYAPDIPYVPGTPGYFADLLAGGLVAGPVVTTRSKYDLAVGRFYPIGAEIKRQFVLRDTIPKYGAIGAFGIQGLGPDAAEDLPMGASTYAYGFQAGRAYNLEASEVIRNGSGAAGAHSDIAHPEVAHAFWEAVLAGA